MLRRNLVNAEEFLLILILSVGAVLQGVYIHLFQIMPIGSLIKIATATLFFYVLARLLRERPGQRLFQLFSKSFTTVYITLLYGALLALNYRGDDLLLYLGPIISLLSFVCVLFFIAFFADSLRYVIFGVVLCCLVIALAHFLNTDFKSYSIGTGHSGLRYGSVDGRNIINTTAQNLAYLMLASYLIFRFLRAGKWVFACSGVATLLFVPPLLAAGSRAAYLTALIVVCVSEARILTKRFSVRLVGGLVGLAILGVYFVSEYQLLFSYSFERMSLLGVFSEVGDEAIGARIENFWRAVDADVNLMFGAGLSGNEFLSRSSDNAFANIIIGFGVVGLVIFMLTIYFSASGFARAARIGGFGIVLVLAPLVIRALSEGTFFSKSALFPAIFYFVAVGVALSRESFPLASREGASRRRRPAFATGQRNFGKKSYVSK